MSDSSDITGDENKIPREDQNVQTKHVLSHCRTECNIKTITFVWSIANFWDISDFIDTLTSGNIAEQSFKLQMHIDRKMNKLNFFAINTTPLLKIATNIYKYDVCIQGDTGTIMLTGWKMFSLNTVLYSMCLKILRLNTLTYVPNNVFTIQFRFELFENMLNSTTFETIAEIQPFKHFVFDDKSDPLLTFIIDEKSIKVKKSLLCAEASVFYYRYRDITEETNQELELRDIPYDTFKQIIHFYQTGFISLNPNDTDYIAKLRHFLEVANNYDLKRFKRACEKCLMENTMKENAVLHLNVAIANNAKHLENYAKKLIKLYLDDIMNTEDFLDLIRLKPIIFPDIMRQKLLEENVTYTCNSNNEDVSDKDSSNNISINNRSSSSDD
ncbi:uncharacterized protein LOC105200741 [Solenopsis invicta]|uniref:uncharacterized protein LOC105200741 n=1 Tax=Solenopsis invicta TaxID=13686 RepID=UPI000595B8D4|nr:uncharacterized protein LOC105200741 [Solenopsis invicta]